MELSLLNIIGETNLKKMNKAVKNYKYSIYLAFIIAFVTFGSILLTHFENKLVYIIGILSMISIMIYIFIAKIYVNKSYLKFVLTPMIQNIYTNGELNKTYFTENDYINSGLACYKKGLFDNRKYHNYTSINVKNKDMVIDINEILITKNTVPGDYPNSDEDVVEKSIIVKYNISNFKNKSILTNITIDNILNTYCYDTTFNITNDELFVKITFYPSQTIIFSTSSSKSIEKNPDVTYHYDILSFIKYISDELIKLNTV